MDPSLILDKLSHGRDGGLAGLGDEKIRESGLADHGSLFIQQPMYWTVAIITGPRADGQTQECRTYPGTQVPT